jgi:hypothetical protein
LNSSNESAEPVYFLIRLHEKEKVIHTFREIERFLKDSGENVDRDLQPDNLERTWNQLMMVYEERDHIIHEEIAR